LRPIDGRAWNPSHRKGMRNTHAASTRDIATLESLFCTKSSNSGVHDKTCCCRCWQPSFTGYVLLGCDVHLSDISYISYDLVSKTTARNVLLIVGRWRDVSTATQPGSLSLVSPEDDASLDWYVFLLRWDDPVRNRRICTVKGSLWHVTCRELDNSPRPSKN
jgi:hypothetical protein